MVFFSTGGCNLLLSLEGVTKETLRMQRFFLPYGCEKGPGISRPLFVLVLVGRLRGYFLMSNVATLSALPSPRSTSTLHVPSEKDHKLPLKEPFVERLKMYWLLVAS